MSPSRLKLIVPYVEAGLAEEVRELGESLGARFFLTPRQDVTSYSRLMAELWAAGEGFLVVEQDVLPTVAMLEEMWTCPEEWCSGWWPWRSDDPPLGEFKCSQWLGCSKFSASLLRRAPGAMSLAPCHHAKLDIGLWYALRGILNVPTAHVHDPAVTHLHREMEARRGTPAHGW